MPAGPAQRWLPAAAAVVAASDLPARTQAARAREGTAARAWPARITGRQIYYGGGGGGFGYPYGGAGGAGGGGAANSAGTNGLGGGGGGAWGSGYGEYGQAGGSGTVVVSYAVAGAATPVSLVAETIVSRQGATAAGNAAAGQRSAETLCGSLMAAVKTSAAAISSQTITVRAAASGTIARRNSLASRKRSSCCPERWQPEMRRRCPPSWNQFRVWRRPGRSRPRRPCRAWQKTIRSAAAAGGNAGARWNPLIGISIAATAAAGIGPAFAIDAATGKITVNNPALLAAGETWQLMVQVTDASTGLAGQATVMIFTEPGANAAAVPTLLQSVGSRSIAAVGTSALPSLSESTCTAAAATSLANAIACPGVSETIAWAATNIEPHTLDDCYVAAGGGYTTTAPPAAVILSPRRRRRLFADRLPGRARSKLRGSGARHSDLTPEYSTQRRADASHSPILELPVMAGGTAVLQARI